MKKENEKNTIEKVNMSSQSIDDVNILNLAKLFPNCVREGKVDFEIFKKIFNQESVIENVGAKQIEKYSISWAGKSESIKNMRTESTGTFKRDGKGVNEEETENIFIEGDNLEVLKLLQKRYFAKIKMIYIDPPYNTGKDFVYKDNFKDNVADYYENTGQTDDGVKMTTNTEKNGRFHSDWLTMMYPRLSLARNLLRDDGVIFVSIGDQELSNLNLIMNEIFGEDNLVAIISRMTKRGGNKGDFNKPKKDNILVYFKNINSIITEYFGKNVDTENIKWLEETFNEEKRYYTKGDTPYREKLETRKNQRYYVEAPDGSLMIPPGNVFPLIKKDAENIIPESDKDKCWTWSRDRYLLEKNNNRFIFLESNNSPFLNEKGERSKWNVYKKVFKDEKENQKEVFIDFLDSFPNSLGTKDLKEFNLDNFFNNPKPTDLIKYLISIVSSSNDNDIILDFFSGSGTTAHAVMDLNAEDGGNRKYICVQLPEATDENSEAYKAGYKTISQITRERINRAGEKIKDEVMAKFLKKSFSNVPNNNIKREDKEKDHLQRGKEIDDIDLGFKSYTLTSSNYRKWENIYNDEENIDERVLAQAKLLTESPLIDNYQEINVVYEILLKEGFDLNSHVEKQDKYYVITEKSFVEDENQNNKDDEKVENIKVEKVRRIYISFAKEIKEDEVEKLSLTEFDIFVCFDSALNDSVKANLCEKKFINFKVKTI